MISAALGALGAIALIFLGVVSLAWKLANIICDYLERGRHG